MTDLHSEAAGLERVTATLRRLPAADPRAADRIVAAALRRQQAARQRRTWLAIAAGLVLAAGVGAGGTLLVQRAERPAAVAEVTPAAAPATTVPSIVRPPATATLATAGAARDEAPVTVSFTLARPAARRVALVGDFDDWSPTAIPMTRDARGTWSITVDLTPGRHAYAFVVDDSVWVTDPRAELVRDPDYGRDHSVVLVGGGKP